MKNIFASAPKQVDKKEVFNSVKEEVMHQPRGREAMKVIDTYFSYGRIDVKTVPLDANVSLKMATDESIASIQAILDIGEKNSTLGKVYGIVDNEKGIDHPLFKLFHGSQDFLRIHHGMEIRNAQIKNRIEKNHEAQEQIRKDGKAAGETSEVIESKVEELEGGNFVSAEDIGYIQQYANYLGAYEKLISQYKTEQPIPSFENNGGESREKINNVEKPSGANPEVASEAKEAKGVINNLFEKTQGFFGGIKSKFSSLRNSMTSLFGLKEPELVEKVKSAEKATTKDFVREEVADITGESSLEKGLNKLIGDIERGTADKKVMDSENQEGLVKPHDEDGNSETPTGGIGSVITEGVPVSDKDIGVPEVLSAAEKEEEGAGPEYVGGKRAPSSK